MELMRQIQKHGSTLIIDNAQNHHAMRERLFRALQDAPTISLGLIHPYSKVIQSLDEAGVRHDNLFYIDCVSAAAYGGDIERTERVLFVHEASDLTGMAMAIDAFLTEVSNGQYIVVTALPVLHYYNPEWAVLHFVRFLLERARGKGARVVVMSPGRQDEALLRRCRRLFDNVIEGDGHD